MIKTKRLFVFLILLTCIFLGQAISLERDDVMASIPVINVGGVDYDVKDSVARETGTQALYKVDSDVGKNLFNKNSDQNITGKYINSEGNLANGAEYGVSHYIPAKSGVRYTITKGGSENTYALFLKKDLSKISTTNAKSFVTPSNTEFMRITYYINQIENVQVEEGATATSYEQYTALNHFQKDIDEAVEIERVNTSLAEYTITASTGVNEMRISKQSCKVAKGLLKEIYIRSNTGAANKTGTICVYQKKAKDIFELIGSFKIKVSGEYSILRNGIDFEFGKALSGEIMIGLSRESSDTSFCGVNYVQNGLGSYLVSGEPLTFDASSGNMGYGIGLGFTVYSFGDGSNSQRVDVGPLYSLLDVNVSGSDIRFGGEFSTAKGYLHSITFKATNTGSIVVYFLSEGIVSGKFNLDVDEGLHEYINGVHFNYSVELPMGTHIGYKQVSAHAMYGFYTNAHSYAAEDPSKNYSIGDSMALTNLGYDIGIGFSIYRTYEDIASNHKPHGTIVLKPGRRHYADEDEITCNVTLSGVSSAKLDILRSGSGSIKNGSAIFVDFANNAYGYYEAIGSADDTLVVSKTVHIDGVNFRVNGHYNIKYRSIIEGTIFIITDLDTGDSFTDSNTTQEECFNRGAVSYKTTGTVTVNYIKQIANANSSPKTLILGDSWTTGSTVWGNRDKRWCSLYSSDISDNTFIYSMGGAVLGNGMYWLNSLEGIVTPEYVILEFGINHSYLPDFISKASTLIDYIKHTMHAIPVLVTIPPTEGGSGGGSGGSGIYQQINEFVKNSGELYIDMCTPLTVDGDGITINESLFFADKVHPNLDGHQAIYEQMKTYNPELFGGKMW